jgi:hypothetical protein
MNNTVPDQKLTCTLCGSEAVLYKFPHQYAGLWECLNAECAASDTHEHDEIIEETVPAEYLHQSDNGIESDEYEVTINVCATCGVEVEY